MIFGGALEGGNAAGGGWHIDIVHCVQIKCRMGVDRKR